MLKHFLLFALAICIGRFAFSAEPVVPAKIGEMVPPLSAIDENGTTVSINQFKNKMGVIVFFFPKAFTGGCVCENAGFRDYLSKYTEKGYVVLGASRDDPAVLTKFKDVYHLNYTLLSDPNDALATALGLDGAQRDTAVIGKDGRLFKVYHSVIPAKHFKELLGEL